MVTLKLSYFDFDGGRGGAYLFHSITARYGEKTTSTQ